MSKCRRVGRHVRWRLREALAPRRTVCARGLRLSLDCDNWITQFRMETVETKEPETLDWIDTHLAAGDLFFDVGGNVGIFSLYAALRHPRARVIAFEPEYANLHVLRDNIVANGLSGRIQVYPIALSDRTGLSCLHVQDLTPGSALHTESVAALSRTESGGAVVMSEGTWAMTLDDFCRQAGVWPNALKIDVDGGEARILAGATETLSRPAFRSLIVEAPDGELASDAHRLLQQAGLRCLATARDSTANNEVWAR